MAFLIGADGAQDALVELTLGRSVDGADVVIAEDGRVVHARAIGDGVVAGAVVPRIDDAAALLLGQPW